MDELIGGIKYMISTVLSHRTLRRRDTSAGIAHTQIFYGFAICFIATSIITLEYDITSIQKNENSGETDNIK